MDLVNKLVPWCTWLQSGALEIPRLRLNWLHEFVRRVEPKISAQFYPSESIGHQPTPTMNSNA